MPDPAATEHALAKMERNLERWPVFALDKHGTTKEIRWVDDTGRLWAVTAQH